MRHRFIVWISVIAVALRATLPAAIALAVPLGIGDPIHCLRMTQAGQVPAQDGAPADTKDCALCAALAAGTGILPALPGFAVPPTERATPNLPPEHRHAAVPRGDPQARAPPPAG
jgi:hypothetical protein